MPLKKCTIRVNKRLIILKALHFTKVGGYSVISPFVHVILKQKGLTILHISLIYALLPAVRFIGPMISGVISDKTGRSKRFLLGNTFLYIIMLNAFFFIPDVNTFHCGKVEVSINCSSEFTDPTDIKKCNFDLSENCEISCTKRRSYIVYDNFNSLIYESLLNESAYFSSVYIDIYNVELSKIKFPCQSTLKLPSLPQSTISNESTSTYTPTCILQKQQSLFENSTVFCEFAEYDNRITIFSISLIVIFLQHILWANVSLILYHTTMCMVKEHNADFGQQCLWGMIGYSIFPALSGLLVDATTKEAKLKNYITALYLFNGVAFFQVVVTCLLTVPDLPPGKKMLKKSISLIKHMDFLIFLSMVLFLGIFGNVYKQVEILYLDSLGASTFLLGLSRTLVGIFNMPFLATSNFWIRKLGSINIVVLGMISYLVYFTSYSFLYNPWWSLAIAITTIFRFELKKVAVVHYCYDIAPEGIAATVLATSGSFERSGGRIIGGFVGGALLSALGGRMTYRIMAIISAIVALLYTILLYSRHYCRNRRTKFSLTPEKIASSENTQDLKNAETNFCK